MLKQRSSGILMHVTSVPSEFGIGDFGPAAYKFADFLAQAGQNCWQILPLNRTMPQMGHSPYSCFSAFAGNPLLISPALLCQDGLLSREDLAKPPAFPAEKVDFKKASAYKKSLLDKAFQRFAAKPAPTDYERFCTEHQEWLQPFAVFVALKRRFGKKPWSQWPAPLRNRQAKALAWAKEEMADAVDRELFLQYTFYKQYLDLKQYCHQRGVQMVGDLPIYVAYDSADVWLHPEVFKLSATKKPRFIAGVPPDYFSKTGQLWGNPVYDWDHLRGTDFEWWITRMKHNLLLYDFVRIDHFRGLIAYWEVPAGHKTAERGKWVEVPHDQFFHAMFRHIPFAAIFAEDLGHITADVREAVAKYDFPCMKVLQFGFNGDPARNSHAPHNHKANMIVYTGTHDNNTTRGWFDNETKGDVRKRLFEYLGHRAAAKDISWELMRLAMASVARMAIIPMQDVLGLGAKARMNYPSKAKGNWDWRMRNGQLTASLAKKLRRLTEIHGRL